MTRSHDEREDRGFDEVFMAQWAKVVRIAQRVLGPGSAAEDVAQDAFLSYYRRFGDATPERPGPWLYAAATHGALNALRAQRRRDRREAEDGLEHRQTAPDPAAQVVAREAGEELRDAMRRLRPTSAAILALRYAGLHYHEIAETLDIPLDQVGTRLRRAEIALRKEILHATRDGR